MVHLHGGPYCIGSPVMAMEYAARLSRAARAAVLVPDFPLTPEHPFPVALDDAMALVTRLVDGRDSPEAGSRGRRRWRSRSPVTPRVRLAVAACHRLRRQGPPTPVTVGLACPVLDLAAARTALPDGPLLTLEWIDGCGVAYTAGADPTDPEISPLRGPLDSLPRRSSSTRARTCSPLTPSSSSAP